MSAEEMAAGHQHVFLFVFFMTKDSSQSSQSQNTSECSSGTGSKVIHRLRCDFMMFTVEFILCSHRVNLITKYIKQTTLYFVLTFVFFFVSFSFFSTQWKPVLCSYDSLLSALSLHSPFFGVQYFTLSRKIPVSAVIVASQM